MAAKSALVTGGAGFIGTHLARQLVESGEFRRVVSLDIAAPQRPAPRVIYHKHDIRFPFHTTIDGHFDVVFNLAAVHRTPGHPDCAYYDTNVAGATNAVAFCERNGIDTLFFTSSIAVYGPSERQLDESSEVNPQSAYGRSKKLAEETHVAWQERAPGRRLRIVRPAVVFGEGENGNYTLLARLLKSGFFAFPARRDTLKASGYVKELTRSMCFALNRPESFYLYNFADSRVPTAEEICSAFCEQGGVRRPVGVIPIPIMLAAAGVCQLLDLIGIRNPISWERVRKLIYSTNVVPRRLIEDGYPFAYTLRSALSDWLATDDEVRPKNTLARPVTVPPLVFDDLSTEDRPTAARVG